MLKPGLKGESSIVVSDEHTAPHVGSGVVPVLATPVMVNLLEAAALAAVEKHLPRGYQTLGTVLNVRHFAATPVGMKVTASAELTAVNGRTLVFRLSAEDEAERIGEGTHERVVVNVERFEERVKMKTGLQD
ncbi:MAG: thioesterase [Gammaproteobacteria bacterium]|nr:thioesterase [Gammaproteobacteria bacterium]